MRYGAYKVDILRNIFPRNPTQTTYLRFLENPRLKMKTGWEDAQEEFQKKLKMPDLLGTYYTKMLKQGDEDD